MSALDAFRRPFGGPDKAFLISLLVVTCASLLIAFLPYTAWAASLVLTALVMLSLLLLRAALAHEPDRHVRRVVMLALGVKLAAGFGQYVAISVLYGGVTDSLAYHRRGAALALAYQAGEWPAPDGRVPGTGVIEILVAGLYTLIGPNIIGCYLAFSWLAFGGLYLLYRAFSLAVPEGNRLLYAVLVLLLPSLVFWPSAIGKEAWMMLAIGICAYGTARLYSGRRGGLPWLGVGLCAAALVRPHIALIVLLSIAVGALVRPATATRSGAVGKVTVLALLVGAVLIVLSQTQDFLGVSAQEGRTFGDVLEQTADQTSSAGSSFQGVAVTDPLSLPYGIVSVLFRPFLYEARNPQALAAALEGLALVALVVLRRRSLRRVASEVLRQPYLAFCVTYILLFCMAFASFSNFGILTRQRVQVLPFLLVLIALPALRRRPSGRTGTTPARTAARPAAHSGPQPLRNHSTV